jgi:hypothetical protein
VEQAAFAEQHDTQRVVELGIGERDTLDRSVADVRWKRAGKTGQLLTDIGGGIQEKPPFSVGTDCRGGLGTRPGAMRLRASCATGGAPAVPLRKATTSRSTEKDDAQTGKNEGPAKASPLAQVELQRGDVSGHFHGYGDDFGFGLGPGHDVLSA